jgi:hypothetical protein
VKVVCQQGLFAVSNLADMQATDGHPAEFTVKIRSDTVASV